MKVISIVGNSNCGKTGSIKYAMKYMINNKYTKILYYSPLNICGECDDSIKNCVTDDIDESIGNGIASNRNIKILIVSLDNRVIGLTTYDDSLSDIHEAINTAVKIVDKQIDCFVCGRHEKNEIESEFLSFGLTVDNVIVIKKEKSKTNLPIIWDKDNMANGLEIYYKILNDLF